MHACIAEELALLTKSFQADQARTATEISALQDKLLQSEQQQQLLQIQLDSSYHSKQLLQQELSAATTANTAADAACSALEAQCSHLQQQLQQDSASSSLAEQSAVVLQLLEGQLISLSGQLKQRDQQIAALHQTVQQQCDERVFMQIHLTRLSRAAGNATLELSHDAASLPEKDRHAPSVATAGASSSNDRATSQVNNASSAKTSPPSRLNRLASASEQSMGKTGLLARILATDSTTGKPCR